MSSVGLKEKVEKFFLEYMLIMIDYALIFPNLQTEFNPVRNDEDLKDLPLQHFQLIKNEMPNLDFIVRGGKYGNSMLFDAAKAIEFLKNLGFEEKLRADGLLERAAKALEKQNQKDKNQPYNLAVENTPPPPKIPLAVKREDAPVVKKNVTGRQAANTLAKEERVITDDITKTQSLNVAKENQRISKEFFKYIVSTTNLIYSIFIDAVNKKADQIIFLFHKEKNIAKVFFVFGGQKKLILETDFLLIKIVKILFQMTKTAVLNFSLPIVSESAEEIKFSAFIEYREKKEIITIEF